MSYVGLTGHEKPCRDPGSSRGPSDLQSNAPQLSYRGSVTEPSLSSQAFLAKRSGGFLMGFWLSGRNSQLVMPATQHKICAFASAPEAPFHAAL